MPQRLIDSDLSSLVPDSMSWANGNIRHWIETIGNFEQMIGYGEIFWPDFIEYDDCILVAGATEGTYRSWLSHFGEDRAAVERMINHIDLNYLFQSNPNLNPADDQLTYLGRLLQEMWHAKLTLQFPGRRVVVDFIDDPDQDPMITVYQPREPEE